MLVPFLSGITVMGCCVIGLFFLRFWQQTGDRFFGIFALSFWIFAINRFLLLVLNTDNENSVAFYSLRLLAFIIILIAIIDKNRSIKNL